MNTKQRTSAARITPAYKVVDTTDINKDISKTLLSFYIYFVFTIVIQREVKDSNI